MREKVLPLDILIVIEFSKFAIDGKLVVRHDQCRERLGMHA